LAAVLRVGYGIDSPYSPKHSTKVKGAVLCPR
jgi:hypothetical protein